MPKLARYTLVWLTEERYELREESGISYEVLPESGAWWLAWLTTHASFSFRGQAGHLTLLKERRRRGGDYWYAYRSQKQRTSKRYAGRTADLTLARLEAVAVLLADRASAVQPERFIPQQPTETQPLPASTLIRRDMPLLEPRLHLPRLPVSLVRRPRLLARLDAILEQKLLVLSAPPGFGKTTLVGQWIEQKSAQGQPLPVAWISLEKSDNDPILFWRYVITACQIFSTDPEHASFTQILAGFSPLEAPSLEIALTLFLNDLAHFAGHGLLVLEDYHWITVSHIHEAVTFLLEHLPSQFHVVLLTRSSPPLPLGRWRASGDLSEMSASMLRFSQEEMADFLQLALAHCSFALSGDALVPLTTRLEGWPVGLRLLSLALQGCTAQSEAEQVLTTFAGGQRSLQDYFVTEVLDAQMHSRQDFLLRTSVLGRLTASLCDAVTERNDSAYELEAIEQAGLFLEALDSPGQWYRYHALFARAMQVEAQHRLGMGTLSSLALKASRWYEQHGMPAEAVEAAFQAQDLTRAATLIEASLEKFQLFARGLAFFHEINGFHTLKRWLEQLPKTMFAGHPLLSLGYAQAQFFIIVVDQVPPTQELLATIERSLQLATEGFRLTGDALRRGSSLALLAQIARQQDTIHNAVAYARESLRWLPEDDQAWRNLNKNVIGVGNFLDGQLEEARKIFLELCSYCQTLGGNALLRANMVLLNLVDYEQGKLRQVAVFFHQMLIEATAEGDRDDVAHASLLLACLAYEWNDLRASEQQAVVALDLGQQIGSEEFQVQAELLLARIELARGAIAQAQQRCITLLARFSATSPLRLRLGREIQVMQARISLTLGDFSAFERWRRANPPLEELPLTLREQEELLVVRQQLAAGEAEKALPSLTHLLDRANRQGQVHSALKIQVLLVLTRYACGNVQDAKQLLQALLVSTQAEGYLRLFLDEGEAMMILLRMTLPQLHERALSAYAQKLLSASLAGQAAPDAVAVPAYTLLAEPLSQQEQLVLRLLLAGHSNPEIARDLVVSVNTVKAHLKNLYRKLDVKNRLQACEAARHLNFL